LEESGVNPIDVKTPAMSVEGLRKTTESSVRIAGAEINIESQHFSNEFTLLPLF
jgi:hypothetical protein